MLVSFGIGVVTFLLLGGLPLYIGVFALCMILFSQTDQLPLISCVVSFTKLQTQDFVSAIPLFTFSGYVLAKSNSPQRIISAFEPLFGIKQGLDVLLVLLVMSLFTALTGASGVGILALGSLLFSMLQKNGRSEQFCLGLITCSGSIGLLLAPSLPVIIYGLISSQNSLPEYVVDINMLFRNGILPTILLVSSITLYSIFFEPYKKNVTPFSWDVFLKNFLLAKLEIPIPILVYLGIYLGWITVLEASVLSALYVCVIVFFIHKDLKFKDFFSIVIESNKLSGSIFIIMAVAFSLTNYLVDQHIPQKIFQWITIYIQEKYSFLALMNLFLLLCGCILDIFSAILILLPIMLPIAQMYGIDPYHFAIIFLVNLEIGYLTPPVGMNLFIASHRFKKSITQVYKSSFPFLVCMICVLLLITYIPWISSSKNNQLKDQTSQTKITLQGNILSISKYISGPIEIRSSKEYLFQEEDFDFIEDVPFQILEETSSSYTIKIDDPKQNFVCIKMGELGKIFCIKKDN